MGQTAQRGANQPPIAARLKKARQRKGLSRRAVAEELKVNVSAVVAWEAGKYLPRDNHRVALAGLLNVELDALFDENGDDMQRGLSASLLRGPNLTDEILVSATSKCERRLDILRVAQPYGTIRHHQRDFRQFVSQRLLNKNIEVQQVEIFYNLDRLQEVLSNILRYDQKVYHIKAFVNAPAQSVFPGIDAYLCDGEDSILASYWGYGAPDERPLIRISGEPFKSFIQDYWREVWRGATSLNFKGADELGLVQEIAYGLGLTSSEWPKFLEDARTLDIGDGAPPLP